MAKKGRSKRAAVLNMVSSVTGIGAKQAQPQAGPSDDDMINRYFHNDAKPCPYSTHRNGNCTTRSQCYKGLGEYQAGIWKMMKDFGHNPEDDVREEGALVGLKNLGATCYMNSLLQCLFMNLTFRRGIYEWRPLPGQEHEPSVVAELQRIFGALQLCQRSSFAPKALTELLQIRTSVQQDAQEFNNLFVGLLEEKLKECRNSSVRTLVQRQFQGKSSYQTVCEKCHNVSSSDASFHELVLSIQDSKTLEGAIKTYLKKEELKGDNQYNCSTCGLADASRKTLLRNLPEVLNFQLLRFAYTDKGKVKVRTETSFPRTLDMAPFVEGAADKLEYELSAVLLHIGSSAHGGHYVAHIRDEVTNQWFKFNDSRVSPCDVKDVGDEVPAEVQQKDQLSKARNMVTSVVKQARKKLSSTNAYMLVYTKKDRPLERAPAPPRSVVEDIAAENAAFFSEIAEFSKARNKAKEVVQAHEKEYEELVKVFPPSCKEDIYWISTTWLRKWVAGEDVPPIDNSRVLCSHEKLSPYEVRYMKQISKQAWEILLAKYGGGPTAPQSNACATCSIALYDQQLTQRHNRAARERVLQMISRGSREGFYVCRSWVAAWRQATSEEERALISPNINERITCEHGELCYPTSSRRIVPAEAWEYLRTSYPEGPEYPTSLDPCAICTATAKEEQREIAERRKARVAERKQLDSMMLYKLQSIKTHPPVGTYFLVNQLWFSAWKQYITDPRTESPGPIDNNGLLCKHGELNFDPSQLSPSTVAAERRLQRPFVFVTEEQWPTLLELYGGGPEISFTVKDSTELGDKLPKEKKGGKEGDDVEHHGSDAPANEQFVTRPDICLPCKEQRDDMVHQQNLNYEDEWVVVLLPPSSRRGVGGYALRSLTGPKQVRVRLSCTDTVMRIKLQLLEKVNHSPVDQRIFLDEQELASNDTTMAEYGVLPGSVLRLELADQDDEPYVGAHGPEEGFEGSMLAGRPQAPKEWTCTSCTLSNAVDAEECAACGASAPKASATPSRSSTPAAAPAPAPESVPSHACPACTFENKPGAIRCSICSTSLR